MMTIPERKVYPRTGDKQTVYLKHVVTDQSRQAGDRKILFDCLRSEVFI